MTEPADWESGKGAGDENFPVASALIARKNRALVMAFYRVARMADDVADHPTASRAAKLAQLDAIEASLIGADEAVAPAARLRRLLADRAIADRHMLDLMAAFRLDVTKSRYETWAELMDYCALSAAPVGRFMLAAHGERDSLWPMSDALCAALQVINHLQDCGQDYRDLDRVYVPLEGLSAAGLGVEALGAESAPPALRGVIGALARRTGALLDECRPLARHTRDLRLALDIAVIHRLAQSLNARLQRRDPLSQRVHHGRVEAVGLGLLAVAGTLAARPGGGRDERGAA